jgi:putative membrane protein
MDYMFEKGFLGTSAPLFMDMVTLIVAFLPILVYVAIIFAKKRMFKTHAVLQNILFVFSVIVVGYFELGVRVGGGFDSFMSGSDVSYTYALVVLVLHIIIATLMLFYWSITIFTGNYHFMKGLIPGRMSNYHRKVAIKTFMGIIFTSFSGIWVYLLLFVY